MRTITFVLLLLVATPAFALSQAETIAAAGARIIGAAKACDVDTGRLTAATEAIFRAVDRRAASEAESGRAISLFPVAYNTGIDEVAGGRTSCAKARAAFGDLEDQLHGE